MLEQRDGGGDLPTGGEKLGAVRSDDYARRAGVEPINGVEKAQPRRSRCRARSAAQRDGQPVVVSELVRELPPSLRNKRVVGRAADAPPHLGADLDDLALVLASSQQLDGQELRAVAGRAPCQDLDPLAGVGLAVERLQRPETAAGAVAHE